MTAIFGPQMTPVLSGAIVYEWTQEANNYGIITYPDNAIQNNVPVPIGSPIPMQPEFNNLKAVWASVSPSSVAMSAYTPTATTMACPAVTAGWPIDPSGALPPSPTTIIPGSRTTFVFSTGPAVTASSPTASVVVGQSTTATFGAGNPGAHPSAANESAGNGASSAAGSSTSSANAGHGMNP